MRVVPIGLLLWVLLPVQAEVFKWTDSQGQVHYGERPPAETGAEPLPLRGIEVIPDPILERHRQRQQRQLHSYELERLEQGREAAREAERLAKQQRQCTEARRNLARFRRGGLYRPGEGGERHFLDRAEEAELIRTTEASVVRLCR